MNRSAVTDTGRRIPLFRWEVSDADFRKFRHSEGIRLSLFGQGGHSTVSQQQAFQLPWLGLQQQPVSSSGAIR